MVVRFLGGSEDFVIGQSTMRLETLSRRLCHYQQVDALFRQQFDDTKIFQLFYPLSIAAAGLTLYRISALPTSPFAALAL